MNEIFPELPTKLGIYSLTRLLSSRENSELYSATQSYVDRIVAIEVLRPNSSAELVHQFQDTARRRASASLPHVSPVLESTQTGHLRYLIQEQPKGKTLLERIESEGPLTLEQAFTLVQNVADMYCACLEQELAAEPLTLASIYMDGDTFSFFSPVIAGAIVPEQRIAQMEGLVSILEAVLTEEMVARSNMSIIIHWLRHGYGNMPLEWQPLASSLSTLRAQKYTPHKGVEGWKDMLKPSSLKRRVRRMFHVLRNNLLFAAYALAAAVMAGGVTAAFKYFDGSEENLPAVTEKYVFCGTSEKSYAVQVRPVSIEEYGNFLDAWEKMTTVQKKDLNEGMPEEIKDHTPLEWKDQNVAAGLGMEWNGRRLKPSSPVGGVSYWGALAYARYVGGQLPSVAQVKVARQYGGESMIQEWTSSGGQASFPIEDTYVIYPAHGGNPMRESDPAKQEAQRGFRIIFDNNNQPES